MRILGVEVMLNCPIHGEVKSIVLDLHKSFLYKGYDEVSACQCNLCKKIYVNVKGIKTGIIGRTKSGYKIENVYKYFCLPNKFYVITNDEFNKIIIDKNTIHICEFNTNDYDLKYMHAIYDKINHKYYISLDVYHHKINLLNNSGIEFIKDKQLIESEKQYFIPESFYVLETDELDDLIKSNALRNMKYFITRSNEIYDIPARYDKKNKRYYITYRTYKNMDNLIKGLGIKVYNMNGVDITRIDYGKSKIKEKKSGKSKYPLPLNVKITNSLTCIRCHSKMLCRTDFYDSKFNNIKIKLYYCYQCNQYYILREDFKNNKNKYSQYFKNINIQKTMIEENNISKSWFSINLYNNQSVSNFTYGVGKIVKIDHSTVLVDFRGNVTVFRFPECFKTGILKFVDNEYQKSILNFVDEKMDSYVNNNVTLNKNVSIQYTSYKDMRRIPGLVYKVQLIGSSNNHATRVHPVEDVVIKLAYKNPKSKTFDIVSIPMHYCSRCDKYFDMKQSFLQTLQKYNLDIDYFAASFESETEQPIVFKQMDLRELSKLKLFGYSVGSNGLSTGARQELLDFILKNHLMTASEIKSQLQFNIRFIGKKNNMTNAVGDWEKDIDYINEYISSGKIHWKY